MHPMLPHEFPARSRVRRSIAMIASLLLSGAVGCRATTGDQPAGPLTVREAWARAADSGATGAVYLTVVNTDTTAITISGVTTPVATTASIHETMNHEGMVHMTARQSLMIGRDSTVVMAPGGLHVMLESLQRALRAGDTLALTLTLADGRTVPVTATVRAP